MKYIFIAGIDNLVLGKPIGKGYQLPNGLRLTNSTSIAAKLTSDFFSDMVGTIEAKSLMSGKPFVYAEEEYTGSDVSIDAQNDLLHQHLVKTNLFFNFLWLVKDNAANLDLGFLQYPFPYAIQARVSSNRHSVLYSTSQCTTDDISFSDDEIKIALNQINTASLPIVLGGPTGKIDRMSRAFYFLQIARNAPTPAEKIVFYCTCFETLVSTSSTELSHQVSERVAVLLFGHSKKTTEIYRDMKQAYDTRSKLVHGGSLSDDSEKYRQQSKKCDDYLRLLFRQIAEQKDLEAILRQPFAEKINAYFNTLLLGAIPGE